MIDPSLAPRQRLSATSSGRHGEGRTRRHPGQDHHEWVLKTPSSPSELRR